MSMAEAPQALDLEIATFERRRTELEADHNGEWVVFHGADLLGAFGSFEMAAEHAVSHFGSGPFLIRQVGAPPIVMPASVMHIPVRAAD
jgi:hypothetical protein